MTIKLKYFGMIAEGIGCSEEERKLYGSQVEDLRKELEKDYWVLHTVPYQVAVNNRIAQTQHTLTEGDEIALLPPFAGG